MIEAKSRARGMLLGLAIGDALGAPAEGLTAEEVRERFGTLSDFRDSFSLEHALGLAGRLKRKDFDRAIRFWKQGGLYAGDTQQAMLLAYLLGRSGDIRGDDVAEEYLRVAGVPLMGPYFGAFRRTGDGFRTSVLTYRKQRDWRQCGVASPGNGAAARIAPVGFFYREDLDTLFWRAIEVSLVTHRDTRALAAAYAVAWLIAQAAKSEAWPGLDLLRPLVSATRDTEARIVQEYGEDLLVPAEQAHEFSECLERAARAVAAAPDQPAQAVLQAAREGSSERVTSPTDSIATASVATAVVGALSKGAASFEETLTWAVSLGGDADAVGAMVGAVCGAFYGIERIPERWQDGVANMEGILRYADALLKPGQKDLPDPLDTESRLCADEEGARAALAARVLKS